MPTHLDAKEYVNRFLSMRDTLPLFKAENADETVHLGHAFAHAARGMRDLSYTQNRPFRIGLDAISRTGKTTFVRGMLSGLANYHLVEDDQSAYCQATRRHTDPQKGWLRNYDASLDNTLNEHGLPSYLHNDTSEYGLPFLDIVEHPSEDEHNTQFDCLLFLSPTDLRIEKSPRTISVIATNKVKRTEGYQKFLQEADAFRRDGYPPPVWSPKPYSLQL